MVLFASPEKGKRHAPEAPLAQGTHKLKPTRIFRGLDSASRPGSHGPMGQITRSSQAQMRQHVQ